MVFLKELLPIVPSGPGIPGHGQGLRHDGHSYYMATETEIPKNRVVSLVREGNHIHANVKEGRERVWHEGAREWIIVAYDNATDQFVLIETVNRDLMRKLSKYKGRSPAEVIGIIQQGGIYESK